MSDTWPTIELDAVQRMRILAAGIPGATLTERVLPAEFEQVWALLSDLEGEFGQIQPDMRRVTILHSDGDQLEALARSAFGMRARLRGVMRPGWCWLQSRFLLIGMAAAPDPGGTRVAFTGGLRVPGRAALVPIGVGRAGRKAMDRLAEHLAREEGDLIS